jgi:prephenate dehydratase
MSVVAIQGVRGSYSEEAAVELMGLNAEIVECLDFPSTFDAVLKDRVRYAVVPIENKIVGEIAGSMNILRDSGLRVFEKLPLKVMHVLAGTANAVIGSITQIRSHVEALKQCRQFLSSNPGWAQVIGADTASSIRQVVETGEMEIAAIGSRRAAELYGAKIIAENIADDHDNWTTFYLVGK